MSMGFSMDAKLSQNMSLQLTPSQKLSLEILQLNIQNLEQRIEEELESNPLLEVVEKNDEPEADAEAEAPDKADEPDRAEESFVHEDNMATISEYFEPIMGESYSIRKNGGEDEEDDFIGNLPQKRKSLEDYISEQIEYTNPPARIRPYIQLIITHLDERGYLNQPLADLLSQSDPAYADMELLLEAHEFITGRLEPAGLAAADLRECLLIQVRRMGGDFAFELGILEGHFDDLLHNRIEVIAKACKCETARIVEALEFFKTLDFRPAQPYHDSTNSVLRPDASVKYDPPDDYDKQGHFTIQLSKKGLPEIRVIPGEVYKKGKLSKAEKQFLMDRTASGKALLEAIRRRNETLFLVIQAICHHQVGFFENGPTALKPLLMQEIAKDLDMSAATITRTVKDKVVQTDYGIYPLKHFFSLKQVKMGDGGTEDRDEVMEAVRKVIEGEDKSKPLSDAAISKELARLGQRVATRTISKYREILNIPSSQARRKF